MGGIPASQVSLALDQHTMRPDTLHPLENKYTK